MFFFCILYLNPLELLKLYPSKKSRIESYFLQNIKEFELAKQFEGYLSDIYATLCSKTALRRLKTYGFAFGLEFRPICMANFKRLLFGLLFSRIWAKFCSDRLVTLTLLPTIVLW